MSETLLGVCLTAFCCAMASQLGDAQLVSAPAERQASRVAIIPIHGPIDDVTALSVARRVELARADGAQAFVLELDTPGGEMLATLQICNYIKTQMPANSVAWVRPQAYSAGAIIALSAREVVMAPGAAMGDAAPIQALPGAGISSLSATERAKLEAPIISEVVDSARRRGYDEHLVQAFVRLGSELWLIRNTANGKEAIVDREEYLAVFGEEPPRDAVIAPVGADSQQDDSNSIAPFISRIGRDSDEVLEDTRINAQARQRLDSSERGRWTLVGQIARSDQLLVVRTAEALRLGLAKASIADEQTLAKWFAATAITRYEETWSEWLVRFLTSWPVRIGLIVVLVVGFVVESITPGFGLFGSAAAVAFALLIGAPALVGLAQWWELIAVVAGLGLVALDIVILPTGGWVAIIGGLMVMGGLVSSFVTRDLSSPAGQQQLFMGIGSTVAATFGSVAILWLAWKSLPQSRLAMRAILHTAAATGETSLAPNIAMPIPGTTGIAATTLRPSGRVLIGDTPFDAQTSGEFVDVGARVTVVKVRGSSLEVELASSGNGAVALNKEQT